MWFIFDPYLYNEKYNCSILNQAEWNALLDPNLPIALLYLIPGLFSLISYIPTIVIINKAEFQKNTAYILMKYMSYIDVVALTVGSIVPSYYAYKGYSFCHVGFPAYINSVIILICWYIASSLAVFLAFNRCLDLINSNIAQAIFGGKKIYWWIGVSYVYSIILTFFFPVPLFTKIALFFDPFYGISRVSSLLESNYHNYAHTVQNAIVAIALIVTYLYLCVVVTIQYWQHHTIEVTSFQRKLFFQAFIIAGVTSFATSNYVYMQYFPATKYTMIMAHSTFQLSHGFTGITFCFINETVRKIIYDNYIPSWLKDRKITLIKISPAPAFLNHI